MEMNLIDEVSTANKESQMMEEYDEKERESRSRR